MSRNAKLLVGCLGLLFVCGCVCVATFVVAPGALLAWFGTAGIGAGTDQVKARQVASTLADYTLPTGYEERASADFFLAKMVVIGRPDDSGMFIVIGQATLMDRNSLEQLMRNNLGSDSGSQLHQVGTENVTIKGKPVQMSIYETDGGASRQGVVGFDGKSGAVVLLFASDKAQWDKATIDHFLASIR